MINGPVWNEQDLNREGVFPTVLAVGDSWFWYLKSNLLVTLHKLLNKRQQHIVLVRGANGAEAVDYTTGLVRSQIELDLDPVKGYGKTLRAVFLSGGGNDLAGPDDFVPLLKQDCSAETAPAGCFRNGQPTALFRTVTAALKQTIDVVQQKIPGTPVFIHGYDYANPNGIGFLGLGQWLQYPMDLCSVPRALQQDLVSFCIDSYWTELTLLRGQYNGLVHLIDQRGTLGRDEWANELHPTPAGFRKVAKRWEPVLQQAGIA